MIPMVKVPLDRRSQALLTFRELVGTIVIHLSYRDRLLVTFSTSKKS